MTSALPPSQLEKCQTALEQAQADLSFAKKKMEKTEEKKNKIMTFIMSITYTLSSSTLEKCQTALRDAKNTYNEAEADMSLAEEKMKNAGKALDLAVLHLKHEEFVQTKFPED